MGAAISSRMLIAGFVVKRDPFRASCLLSGLMMGSIQMFAFVVDDGFSYVLAAVMLGVGYGLTYSVINGLAPNRYQQSAAAGLDRSSLIRHQSKSGVDQYQVRTLIKWTYPHP